MTTGHAMQTKYNGDCPVCGGHWIAGSTIFFNRGWSGYYCSLECAHHALDGKDLRPYGKDLTTPKGFADASTASTSVVVKDLPSPPYGPPSMDRQQAIAAAHAENMVANQNMVLAVQALTAAVVDLMRVEADRNALLKKGLEAKA